MSEAAASERIDKWLWRARFFRSRALSAAAVARGLRVNGRRVDKPGAPVREGDVLTFVQAGAVRVVEVLALGGRRGPACEARRLWRDPSAPPVGPEAGAADAAS